MVQFLANNWRAILLVYIIIAVMTTVAMGIFWIYVMKGVDDEERLFHGDYEERGWNAFSIILALTTSVLSGVLWIGFPLVLGGVLFCDWVRKKFPTIMGYMCEETEEEKDDD